VTVALIAALALSALATGLSVIWLERRHPPRGRFVHVDGAVIHFESIGPEQSVDPPIVLIPGANSSIETMRLPLGNYLSQTRRVILIDRPGQGWSKRKRRSDATPAIHARMIIEVLESLQINRAIFVGHSWGGAVLPAIALDFSDRSAGLIMIAAVTHPWDGDVDWIYRACTFRILGTLLAYTIVLPYGLLVLNRAIRSVFSPQNVPANFAERSQAQLLLRPDTFLNNAWDLASLRSALAEQSPRYRKIQTPIVLVDGGSDQIVSTDIHSRQFTEAVSRSKLIVLPGVGHMPHFAAPAIIQSAIEDMAKRSDA